MSDSDGTYNTLIARVTRHFASFFCRTTYVYTRGYELRNRDVSSLERKSVKDSYEFSNNVRLTSPLAKARLIGVSSLHSTTRHYPTHTVARAQRAYIHTYIHIHISLPSSLSPSIITIFSLCIFLLIFSSF